MPRGLAPFLFHCDGTQVVFFRTRSRKHVLVREQRNGFWSLGRSDMVAECFTADACDVFVLIPMMWSLL